MRNQLCPQQLPSAIQTLAKGHTLGKGPEWPVPKAWAPKALSGHPSLKGHLGPAAVRTGLWGGFLGAWGRIPLVKVYFLKKQVYLLGPCLKLASL